MGARGQRDDVSRLFAATGIIGSSSANGDGFPGALDEGFNARPEPVVTDVGGSAHIIADCGFVVQLRDSQALPAALQMMVNDPA